MTQIERYAQLMKVNITKLRANIAVHWTVAGSVLAQTVRAGAKKVQTHFEIESPDDPVKVAAVLRNARNGCWARQAVMNPVPFEDTTMVNGKPFDFDDYPVQS
jgi:hypothetical protein